MNISNKAFCRTFQFAFKVAMPLLPYREPQLLYDVHNVATVLKEKEIDSVLLVTDKQLREIGATSKLEKEIAKQKINLAVFDDTRANPTVNNVEQARTLYLTNKCEAIIAFGGGSAIDCAKAVGARIAYPSKSVNKMKGLLKVLRKIPTLIAIPTTAGTGSEVTVTAVITDSEKKHKYTMNNFTFIPDYAVLDPSVTVSLPKSLTSTKGMDALTHATEAYIGKSTTKETRKLAKESVRLIFENIEKAYNDGTDINARANMLKASYMAGIAFSKSYVGYIHAVAHSLGGEYNIPHGLANAVLMPLVLKKYGKSVHKKLHELAIVAGVSTTTDTDEQGAKKYIKAIKMLNQNMDIKNSFSEIKAEDIDKMAQHATKEANPLYPVPVLWNKTELTEIYKMVANGDK